MSGIRTGRGQGQNVDQGVTGPKFLGVRELTYKLAFMASSTQVMSRLCLLTTESTTYWVLLLHHARRLVESLS